MFQAFLSPLSHYFDSAGIVHSRREKIAHSENLKAWTDIWADLDIRVRSYRFAILGWLLATLIFQRQTVTAATQSFLTTASLFFLFRVKC